MKIKDPGPDPSAPPLRMAAARPARTAILAAGGVLVLAALAAYRNSLHGPFIFDDVPAIRDNTTLRQLWPLGPVLSPDQGGMTTSGRPIVNLSFALNHAFSGLQVWGYHATNLAIHILAGLILFGIARRTLARMPMMASAKETGRTLLALGIALIWTVHPLETEAVTYTVQRAESLMGLLYLLTLYFFLRTADSEVERLVPKPLFDAVRGKNSDRASDPTAWGQAARPRKFLLLSIFFCLLGMATKEVMVSAPVIVLLYDRTFVAGSFREAWRSRWRYYLGLAATWIPLAYFVFSTKNRGGTAGLDADANITAVRYWLTQFPAIVLYLKLAVWPRPLALDYGTAVALRLGDVAGYAAVVIGLAVGTVYAFFRGTGPGTGGRALGFAGVWFFAVLAPTSVVPIVVQIIAEHRMYLALAPVVAAAVLVLYRLIARILDRGKTGRAVLPCFCLCLLASAGYGFMTFQRNQAYGSAVGIWGATVATDPDNARALYNLGIAYHDAGNDAAAIDRYRESLRIKPNSPEAHTNWGIALSDTDHWSEAVDQFREALRLKPDYMEANYNLGNAYLHRGDLTEAIASFEQAIRLSPDYADAYYNLGIALVRAGRPREAVAPYERALRIKPDYVEADTSLGAILFALGRVPEAIDRYRAALRLQPGNVEAHTDLGIALGSMGHLPEAISELKEAARLKPDFYLAHLNLGHAYQLAGRTEEAQAEFEEAVRLNGGRPPGAP